MAARPLVYVHGAGPQKNPAGLKQDLDAALFGRAVEFSRVAYYADVRWPPGANAAGARAIPGDRADRTRRQQAIRRSAQPGVSAKEAAADVVGAASRGGPASRGRPEPGRPAVGRQERPPAEALRLVEQLYRRADRIAARSGAPAAAAGTPSAGAPPFGISIPDPLFRLVVGAFASDAVDYVYGPWTERMRAPVREALLVNPQPGVIVAHSLGSIIAYDVLSEPAFAGFDVELFVTAGSPLGIGNIQEHLRDGAGRPNPVPTEFDAWANFADPWDPVALDPTLRDEFRPPANFVTDARVNNPAPNNHGFTGYLGVAVVRSTIGAAVGP